MKSFRFALALSAVAFLAGCVYITDAPPSVSLSAGKTIVMSGENVVLTANAMDPQNGTLTYRWEEDGLALDGADATFVYSRFVTVPRTVAIRLTVANAYGTVVVRNLTLSVLAPASPGSLLVVNSSPYSVYYLHMCAAGESDWGPDQMRPSDIIPPGGTFTVRGIPSGTWNLKAVAAGGVAAWVNTVSLAPSQAKTITLY